MSPKRPRVALRLEPKYSQCCSCFIEFYRVLPSFPCASACRDDPLEFGTHRLRSAVYVPRWLGSFLPIFLFCCCCRRRAAVWNWWRGRSTTARRICSGANMLSLSLSLYLVFALADYLPTERSTAERHCTSQLRRCPKFDRVELCLGRVS